MRTRRSSKAPRVCAPCGTVASEYEGGALLRVSFERRLYARRDVAAPSREVRGSIAFVFGSARRGFNAATAIAKVAGTVFIACGGSAAAERDVRNSHDYSRGTTAPDNVNIHRPVLFNVPTRTLPLG